MNGSVIRLARGGVHVRDQPPSKLIPDQQIYIPGKKNDNWVEKPPDLKLSKVLSYETS